MDDYQYYKKINTSLIEQWHAVVHKLGVRAKSMTMEHTLFILLCLMDDHYMEMADAAEIPESARYWPATTDGLVVLEDDDDEDIEGDVDEDATSEMSELISDCGYGSADAEHGTSGGEHDDSSSVTSDTDSDSGSD